MNVRELRHLAANPAMLLGLLGVLALLAMGVFGSVVTPYDPNAGTSMLARELPNGSLSFQSPPTLPDDAHWFGTDALGRDQLSRILAGAKLTLSVVLTAALIRLFIGVTLGLVSGWYGGPVVRALNAVASGITAIPQLLLAIMLVLVTRDLDEIGFIASLALVGWPEIAEFVGAEARRVKAQPYMEAARAIGATGRRLVTGHLATALGPQLLSVAALETGAVLVLLAELGLVGLFLAGATSLVGDFGISGTLKDRAPEWGQMLGTIQFFAMIYQLGTLIPAFFVVLAATSFALLADGLRAASDPFSIRRLSPRALNAVGKVLAGALCFTAVGFATVNVPTGPLTMDEGRELAAKTAKSVWPGSVFVAGVARYLSFSYGLERPYRLTYYYRTAEGGAILRISFQNADRLAVEVRRYETEDEIDFTTLRPIPAGVVTQDVALAKAEEAGGAEFRERLNGYLVRAIVTWPSDRETPVYTVTYGTSGRGQLALSQVCCVDATNGQALEGLRLRPIELPSATFAATPAYPGHPWTRDGRAVGPEELSTIAGPSHCGWQSVTFLTIGWPVPTVSKSSAQARQYVRDARGVLRGPLSDRLELYAKLPSDARPSGYVYKDVAVYLNPFDQDEAIYLVSPSGTERWPRSDPMTLCT
jgi:peptide/nickel transport system permease protein